MDDDDNNNNNNNSTFELTHHRNTKMPEKQLRSLKKSTL